MQRQYTRNAASAYFFTRSGEVIYFVFLCSYSLYIVKYIFFCVLIAFCEIYIVRTNNRWIRTLYPILYRDHIILVIYWVSYYIQLYRLIGNMHVLEGCRMPEFELDIKYSFKGFILKKYKTFSVLIYSYINTSGNWKNEKLCGNTTPAGRSVFTQFRVFPIFTSVDITVYQYGKNVLYFFYNIAQRTLTEKWREIFRVDIELYQHGS